MKSFTYTYYFFFYFYFSNKVERRQLFCSWRGGRDMADLP